MTSRSYRACAACGLASEAFVNNISMAHRLSNNMVGKMRIASISTMYESMNFLQLLQNCLKCFDAVGWAAGRASGL